jgi:hypothetical protein
MDKIIHDISERMVTRYSDRYKKLGYDVKTLGWGSKEQQLARFEQTVKGDGEIDFTAKTILDIGCGFGDPWRNIFRTVVSNLKVIPVGTSILI